MPLHLECHVFKSDRQMFILMIETDKQANNYNMLMESDKGMSRKKVGER